jgi:predicted RNA binding protein YcfA (HicA-like mRNA interferase family)
MATTLSKAELERLLSDHGYQKDKTQGKHTKWRHPQRKWVLVPHSLKGEGTLRQILKAAGIDHPKKQERNRRA